MVLKLASGGAQSHMRIALHMYISSRMRKKMGKSRMKHIVEYQNIGRTNQTLEKQLLPTRGRPLLKRLGVGKYKVLFYIFMNAIGIFFYSATTTSSTSETCPAFSKVSSSRDFLAQNFRLVHTNRSIHENTKEGLIFPLLALACLAAASLKSGPSPCSDIPQ